MNFDMGALDPSQRYKIIGACITPRPIAWVTSRSVDGVPNVAPFSFFNAIGNDPPTIVLGMVAHAERRLKDTPTNIRDTREFVVNLVDEAHAQAMNVTALDVASDVDEGVLAGLDLAPSIAIVPPRIATAPASFECRATHFIDTGPHQVAVIAEILHAHIDEAFILDPDRLLIDVPAMRLIARMHGAGWYSRQTDLFKLSIPE